MSIKRVIFDTVVILAFLSTTGLFFNYLLGTQFSNPLLGNSIHTEKKA
ncbi:hypothetical protein VB715_16415 [Crocosphaera sp. UHCC 0190]|nr:hypothetical protein [Crocosphaera sp. UHCC 0190]MEA5511359.1 hypothetical protein [Crocosphaera sp. UHCC 0190]